MPDVGKSGFWQSIPGIITATAGLLSALTGAIVGLNQTGVVDFRQLAGTKPPAQVAPNQPGPAQPAQPSVSTAVQPPASTPGVVGLPGSASAPSAASVPGSATVPVAQPSPRDSAAAGSSGTVTVPQVPPYGAGMATQTPPVSPPAGSAPASTVTDTPASTAAPGTSPTASSGKPLGPGGAVETPPTSAGSGPRGSQPPIPSTTGPGAHSVKKAEVSPGPPPETPAASGPSRSASQPERGASPAPAVPTKPSDEPSGSASTEPKKEMKPWTPPPPPPTVPEKVVKVGSESTKVGGESKGGESRSGSASKERSTSRGAESNGAAPALTEPAEPTRPNVRKLRPEEVIVPGKPSSGPKHAGQVDRDEVGPKRPERVTVGEQKPMPEAVRPSQGLREQELLLPGLKLTIPPGWTRVEVQPAPGGPVAALRIPDPDGPDGIVQITHSSGPQGKEADERSIEQWLEQMVRPDGGPSGRKDAKISKSRLGNIELTVVEISGTLKATGREAAKTGQKMIAAILEYPGGSYLVTITGGSSLMAKWGAMIDTFLRSARADP